MNQFANNLKKQLAETGGPAASPDGAALPQAAKPISATSLAGKVAWNAIKDRFGGKSEK